MLYAPVPAGSADIAILFVELGIVIVALALLARLANRFGFSPVPLYLLGGLLIGSLNIVPMSDATEQFIQAASEIGVILLLFMIGLEYTGAELSVGLRTGLPSGVVDFVLNFTPGAMFGLLLGWTWIEAMLLGGVTYISSSGIIAKLLADSDWLGNRETPAVLIVLVMEDLAMALYLPIIVVLLLGTGLVSGSGVSGRGDRHGNHRAAAGGALRRYHEPLHRRQRRDDHADGVWPDAVGGRACPAVAGLDRGGRLFAGHRHFRPPGRAHAHLAQPAARPVCRHLLPLLWPADRRRRAARRAAAGRGAGLSSPR